MIDNVPTNLDWVTARAECSLYKMFKELRNGVKQDVAKRNELRQEGERVRFEMGAESGKGFSVFREGPTGTEAMDFFFENTEIRVADPNNVLFRMTVTVSNDGRCKFVVDGKELEQWQVRKMALEKLFFYT